MIRRKKPPTNHVVPIEGAITPFTPAEPPLPAPNGWVCLGVSHELAAGAVLTRRLLEQDVVIWRTESGAVAASRPYCPHLGAHLGQGGTVKGEEIVCPYHYFAFDREGTCVGNAYGTRPPLKTRLATLPAMEVDGLIMVWYHDRGLPPQWLPPSMGTAGYSRPHYSMTESPGHPQEVVENAADTGHLSTLHSGVLAGGGASVPFAENGHMATTTLRLVLRLPFGRTYSSDYRIEIYGLGYLVAMVDMKFGISMRIYVLPVSVGPWRMQVRWGVSARFPAPRFLPPPLRHGFATGASRGLAAFTHWFNFVRIVMPDRGGDVPQWSSKIYQPRPRLSDGDGPIMRYRRWAAQFYPEGTAVEGSRPAAGTVDPAARPVDAAARRPAGDRPSPISTR